MKPLQKSVLFKLTLAVLIVCLCLSGALALASGEKGLRLGVSWGPDSNPPDPAKGWDGWYCNEIGMTETLLVLDFDQKLVPKLAESFRNLTPTTWEIKLRNGVKFHDGLPLNAKAVKFSFARILDEKSPVFNERLRNLLGLKSISVKDDYTVRFETKKPVASFAYKLADPGLGILSPKSGPKGIYGTGPFKFSLMIPDEKVVVERFDGYWGKKAGLPSVSFVINKDPQAKMLAFEAGDLDVLGQFPEMDVQRVKGDKRFQIHNRETNRVCYFITRLQKGPLANPDIRLALNYAVDRREVVDVVLSGVGGVVGASVFPKVLPWSNSKLKPYPYDPAKAKELLAKAGAVDSDKNGVLEYKGAPLSLKIWTYEGRPSLRPTVELVQAQLKRVGIDSQIRVVKSTSTCEEAIRKDEADLVLYMANSAPQGDPDYFVTTWLGPESSLNYNRYQNKELGGLLKKGRISFDPAERKKIYDRIQEIIYRESPVIVMFHTAKVAASWSHVKNYRIHPAEIYVITPEIKIED